jgi:hypothetical protein
MIVLYEILEVVQAVHFDRPDPRLGKLIERLKREIRHASSLEEETREDIHEREARNRG